MPPRTRHLLGNRLSAQGAPPARPRRARQTVRHAVAALGLVLFVGCLLGLLAQIQRPAQPPGVVTSTPRPQGLPKGTVVVLDPGHGGADTGAVALGMVEKDLTLDIAQRVATVLERQGVPIRLTRDSDRYVPLAARARFANSLPNAVFVSIHLNHARNSPASGIETFYTERKEPLVAQQLPGAENPPAGPWHWLYTRLFGRPEPVAAPPSPGSAPSGAPAPENGGTITESRALAGFIQAKLVVRTAATDRGVKERRLYVTRHVAGPAVLVEGGFVTNPAEARLLGDPAYRQRVADSISDGVREYLSDAATRPRLPAKNVLAQVE